MHQVGGKASIVVTIVASSWLAGCAARSTSQIPAIPSAGASTGATPSSSSSAEKAAGRTYRFLSTGSAAGADRGWGFGLRLNNITGAGSAIRFTNYGIADNDSSVFDVTPGNWVHIAATYNNGQISYYLNGNPLDSDTSAFGNEGAAGRLVIGGRVGGNDTDQMNGLVDGVQVYNQVLTADQIRQAAAASVSVPEPSTMLILGVAGCLALARRQRA